MRTTRTGRNVNMTTKTENRSENRDEDKGRRKNRRLEQEQGQDEYWNKTSAGNRKNAGTRTIQREGTKKKLG